MNSYGARDAEEETKFRIEDSWKQMHVGALEVGMHILCSGVTPSLAAAENV